MEKVRVFVERQKSQGASVDFVEVEGISHYETFRFVQPLREAIPWIMKIWRDRSAELKSQIQPYQ